MALRRLTERRSDLGDNAPIVEALIDIQVTTPQGLELDELKMFTAIWPERFPTAKVQTAVSSEIRLGGKDPGMTSNHILRGFAFETEARDRVVQVRRDGFTFSRVNSYESWGKLKAEAVELWERYTSIAKPERVGRLAVRFINRFPIPEGGVELSEMFNLHPKTPECLDGLDEYLMRLVTHHPDNPEYRAVTIQATNPQEDGAFTIMLDIDVFSQVDLGPDSPAIWEILDDLREFKNDVFFGTITKELEENLR